MQSYMQAQRQRHNERLVNTGPCEQPSLFADVCLTDPGPDSFVDQSKKRRSAAASSWIGQSLVDQKVDHQDVASQDHLAAAQELAKKLRNRRSKKVTRQRTGIAICQHLIALLREG